MDLCLVRSAYGPEIKLRHPLKLMPPPRLSRCAINIRFLEKETAVVKSVLEGLRRRNYIYFGDDDSRASNSSSMYASKVTGTLPRRLLGDTRCVGFHPIAGIEHPGTSRSTYFVCMPVGSRPKCLDGFL